jgi:hypothetical protein
LPALAWLTASVCFAERLVILVVFAPQLWSVVGRHAAEVDEELGQVEILPLAGGDTTSRGRSPLFVADGIPACRGRIADQKIGVLFATSRKLALPVACQ